MHGWQAQTREVSCHSSCITHANAILQWLNGVTRKGAQSRRSAIWQNLFFWCHWNGWVLFSVIHLDGHFVFSLETCSDEWPPMLATNCNELRILQLVSVNFTIWQGFWPDFCKAIKTPPETRSRNDHSLKHMSIVASTCFGPKQHVYSIFVCTCCFYSWNQFIAVECAMIDCVLHNRRNIVGLNLLLWSFGWNLIHISYLWDILWILKTHCANGHNVHPFDYIDKILAKTCCE